MKKVLLYGGYNYVNLIDQIEKILLSIDTHDDKTLLITIEEVNKISD